MLASNREHETAALLYRDRDLGLSNLKRIRHQTSVLE